MKQCDWTEPGTCTIQPRRMSDVVDFRTSSAAHAGLAGLAGSNLADRFRWWRGRSGRRYMFSVVRLGFGDGDLSAGPQTCNQALELCPHYENAILLFVQCEPGGHRRILHMVETGGLPDMVLAGSGLRDALLAGANEIHIHLLAETAQNRRAILADLDSD